MERKTYGKTKKTGKEPSRAKQAEIGKLNRQNVSELKLKASDKREEENLQGKEIARANGKVSKKIR